VSDTGTEPRSGNRWRAIAFRDSVLAFLHESGVHAAHRSGTGFDDDASIAGLPWTVHAHRQRTLSLSLSQDHAAARAAEAGSELYASVHYRKSHPVELAYVTMPLDVFATVLVRLHPELSPTPGSAA